MAVDAQKLWAEKYAARFADAKFREDEAREAAFADVTHTVCGEPLRAMTPRDLLILQALGSPLVYSVGEVSGAHVLQFLWALHRENTGGMLVRHFRRGRMIQRVGHNRRSEDPIGDAVIEISRYIGTMFMDAGGGAGAGESKPLGACWLAPAMVRLGKHVGPRDPFSGDVWADVPLPRIWQYLKAVSASELGKSYKDYSPSDRIMSEWLDEVNRSAQNEGKQDDV